MDPHKDFRAVRKEFQGTSPTRGSSLLLVIFLFLAAAGTWAYLTEIDNVTRADGAVVPSSQTQIVQAPEAGVLTALLVAKGDMVEQGQLLMEFDSTLLDSQFDQERQRIAALQARASRLQAEISGGAPVFDPELTAQVPEIVGNELQLFQARDDEIRFERLVLDAQRRQRLQEYEERSVEHMTAQRTILLIRDEIALMSPLVERRVEPETTMMVLRRSEAEWQGRLASGSAAMQRVQSGLEEIDNKILALVARYRTRSHADLTAANAELAELSARLPAFEMRATRSEVIAPVRGIVNQILLTTRGGVAQIGQALLEIVPVDESLLVEARVRPSDIAFLRPGQLARIKLTAYDYARYGSIEGRIVRIGANAVARPDTQETVFIIEVSAERKLLDAIGQPLEILPGMIAQVDILTGKKTVLDYFIEPVRRLKETALRD